MNNNKGYFAELSAVWLSREVEAGRMSSTELVMRSLQSIDDLNTQLNAFVHVDREGALRTASMLDEELASGRRRSELHGLPIAIKDNIDTADQPTTYGSHFYAQHQPERDAPLVAKLKALGAVIVGKTLTSEFALGPTGEYSYQGGARNPYDPSRVSGGSSAGSAVAVAAGMVPLAVGTDTAGSVRIPAAFCGIVGFKPSYGRTHLEGVFPVSKTLDQVGPLGKSVADAALLFSALDRGPSVSHDGGVRRIAWLDSGDVIQVTSEIKARCRHALEQHVPSTPITSLTLSDSQLEAREVFSTILLSEAYAVHHEYMATYRDTFSREQYERLLPGADLPAWLYVKAQQKRNALIEQMSRLFDSYDLIALPTTTISAPPFSLEQVSINGHVYRTRDAINTLTSVWSLLGLPAISIPAGLVDGLPCGLQLIAAPNRDEWLMTMLSTA